MARKSFFRIVDELLIKFLSADKTNFNDNKESKTDMQNNGEVQWLTQANALRNMQNWQALVDWCRNWTKSEPKNAIAWFSLGNAYSKLNQYDDAIKAYRQAIHINPENALAWHALGTAYGQLKRYDNEIGAYQQSICIDPENATVWFSLGIVYDDTKHYDDAIEAFRQVIRMQPNNDEAWFGLGSAYYQLNQYDDAIEAHRQALRINPNEANHWFSLGSIYGESKLYDEAIEAYLQAIRIAPKFASAWLSLGTTYFLSGNRIAAQEAVKELRRLDSAKADKLFNLIGKTNNFKLEIKNLTLLMDRVSEINEYVEEAMGMPQKGQLDWWTESSYAALFSSTFELFLMFVYSELHSDEDLNNFLPKFTKEVSKKASSWIEKGLMESIPFQNRDKISAKDGLESETQSRLNSYFHISINAMTERNYDIETARSHSCFVILSKEFEYLATIDKSKSPEQIGVILENSMNLCKRLATGVHGEILKSITR